MKTTNKDCFSNGTEHMMWTDVNCCRCLKSRSYRPHSTPCGAFDDDAPNYRCAVERDIDAQMIGLDGINQRSYDATQHRICPYIQTEPKPVKHRKIIGEQDLFEPGK